MRYHQLEKEINKPFFSSRDIALGGLKVYNHQLSEWVNKGYIERIKRGFYVFFNRRNEIDAKEISFHLCNPSYISMELALSYHGVIPEIVYSLTCLTTKNNIKFSNSFGNFIYRNIKPSLFFGYKVIETKNSKYLLAEPEKALLDYLYLNHIKEDGFDEMRVNKEAINKEKLLLYAKEFNSKIINNLISRKIC
ncbi:MAG: type IV toxin-antitoxin system AbiEi family antitoxin domain-containing protein [Candidatus Paceibacterota bacterium]|jgi:predicted transcriptional regulator of viral defense system